MKAKSSLFIVLAAGLAAACALPAAAQTVGNVGAVNPDTTGAPPGRAKRTLTLGAGVVQNERVQTDSQGSAQLVFRDRSALNVGRNSTVVIDRFVFDPGSGAGQMTATITRGALRFVGGAVSHRNGATIRTPTATIGVRGGMVSLAFDSNGALHVIHHFGNVTVDAGGGVVRLRRAGFETIVLGGAPPSAPRRVSASFLSWLMAQLASAQGQHGGARTPPTNADTVNFGIGSTRFSASPPNFDLPGAVNDLLRSRTAPQPPAPHHDSIQMYNTAHGPDGG